MTEAFYLRLVHIEVQVIAQYVKTLKNQLVFHIILLMTQLLAENLFSKKKWKQLADVVQYHTLV